MRIKSMRPVFFLRLSVASCLAPPACKLSHHVSPLKASASAPPASGKGTPKDRLKAHFNKKMQNDDVPLFADFETYVKTMPVRRSQETGEHVRLCELPFWASDEDLERLGNDLERDIHPARSTAKYAAAPRSSGKTASGLVGFLASAEREEATSFTHYLYMAFDNNGENRFEIKDETKLSGNVVAAKEQGAAFALECLKRLFEAETGLKKIDLADPENPPWTDETAADLKKLIDETIPGGRILLHLDEHRKMCLDPDEMVASAAFRRGCMEALANKARVEVYATCTELLELPASWAPATTCRHPVAVPILDLDQVVIDELLDDEFRTLWPVDLSKLTQLESRLWATLKIRLAMKIETIGLLRVHKASGTFNSFRDAFNAAAAEAVADGTSPLEAWNALCAWPSLGVPEVESDAAEILLGVQENQYPGTEGDRLLRKMGHAVVVRTGARTLLTSSFLHLLSINAPDVPVYGDGRERLASVLTSATDDLSATPLEASYTWALACRSFIDKTLDFADEEFAIECKSLEAGRFFATSQNTTTHNANLKENVIYYVLEGKGHDSHPLADLFFRVKDQVVLIDIYGGGNVDGARGKETRLKEWITREQPNNEDLSFYGVVLAPFVNGASFTNGTVTLMRGEEALELLGGLRQLSGWLGPSI